MKSTPSLSNYNRFAVLSVDCTPEIDRLVEQVKDVPNPGLTRQFCPHWECRLPLRLVIASTEDEPRSLKLKVSIETTNTAEVRSVNSLVDSGATGNFIDREYVRSHHLTTRRLSKPVPVFNVDGTPNEAGSITEVVDLVLRYRNHSERTLFAVTGIGKQHLILRHTWLRKHNPEINWASGEVKMSCCSVRCLVFKGPVVWTGKRPETGPNRTDLDPTAVAVAPPFRMDEPPATGPVKTGCNHLEILLQNTFKMHLKTLKMIKI